jgi:hypothetical protein
MRRRDAIFGSGAWGLALAAGPACRGGGEGGLPEVKGGWELGIRRDNSWAHVTVKPPFVVGPLDNLRFRRGRLTGSLSGRATDIRVEKDAITGMIGGRPVQLDVQHEGGQLDLWGSWAGSTMDFVATDDSIRATVPIAATGWCCWEYILRRIPSPPALEAFTVYAGDRRGLPSWGVALEVPLALTSIYTSTELALLVLTVMTAPL